MRMRYSRLLCFVTLSVLALGAAAAGATVSLNGTPAPSHDPATLSALSSGSTTPIVISGKVPIAPPGSPALIGPAIECFNFDDNIAANPPGYIFIPPDPIAAAGLTHVINVGNDFVEWRPKVGTVDTPEFRTGLLTFFSTTPGLIAGSNPFDPKVIYDQYRDRFIIVCLQQVTSPTLQSRILVAVSKAADPNLGWWFHSINSTLNIGGADRWADYPGLGLDDEAVYVCANMYNAAGTSYGGSRLWVINPAPTYAGPDGSIVATVYDAYALSGQPGFATTTQPAQMYGPEPVGVGTFLVSYSGLSDGTDEYLDIVRVDDPLGAISFNFQQLYVGNFDNTAAGLPDAPQLGTARTIEVNDRRALGAVWRDNDLFMCATVLAPAGPDAGQTTAHWFRIDTVNLPALSVADHGDAGAEDLGAGTYTFFPAIMVDCDKNMGLGFAASNANIYCGAYYATRLFGDAAGTVSSTGVLALGTDWYVRTFSNNPAARNRWGDYSGLSICPVDQSTFWVYNEYACTRGTPTTVGGVTEDGRWCTKLGKFFLKQPVTVAVTSFSATLKDGAVSVRGTFRSDLGVQAVNVYRGSASGVLDLIHTAYTVDNRGFEYLDRSVDPGSAYRYQIGVVDSDGEFLSPIADVKVPNAVASMEQNAPNPFNPTTSIRYSLPASEHVTINVYDASGSLVRTLVDEVRPLGTHDVQWDGRDDSGSTVGSGVYFYRITAGKYSESKKMVLLK